MRDLSSYILSGDSQSTPQPNSTLFGFNGATTEKGSSSTALQKRRRKTNLKDEQKIRQQSRKNPT